MVVSQSFFKFSPVTMYLCHFKKVEPLKLFRWLTPEILGSRSVKEIILHKAKIRTGKMMKFTMPVVSLSLERERNFFSLRETVRVAKPSEPWIISVSRHCRDGSLRVRSSWTTSLRTIAEGSGEELVRSYYTGLVIFNTTNSLAGIVYVYYRLPQGQTLSSIASSGGLRNTFEFEGSCARLR